MTGRLSDWWNAPRVKLAANDMCLMFDNLGRKVAFDGAELWHYAGTSAHAVLIRKSAWIVRWPGFFRKWADAGLRISVVFTDVRPDHVEPLLEARERAGGCFGMLAVDLAGCGGRAPWGEDTHPTVFNGAGKDENAMWVEGMHRKGSMFAHNVRYASPKALENDESLASRFLEYGSGLAWMLAEGLPLDMARRETQQWEKPKWKTKPTITA